MSEIPARIGPYRIHELLGQGGMGVVYRGSHVETGRIAAIKTVRVPRAGMVQSIRREIHALARLRHPGIVPILEEGLENGVPWYAMELVAGVTLRRHADLLAHGRSEAPTPTKTGSVWWTRTLETVPSMQRAATAVPMEPAPAPLQVSPNLQVLLTVIRRLCGLLAFLHGEGIVHRDLKPENILLRPDGMPVLMDFGVVSRFGGALSREELEVAGKVSGTVAYMAPEQGRGELVDARADLYSLGCILYELAVGRPPFWGETPLQVLRQHLKVQPTRPSELVQGIDPQLEALILRLLEKDPHRRLGHADDVSKALAGLGASNGWSECQPKPRAYLYRPRFVGRHAALQDLLRLLELASEDRGSIALLGGESGIGKTRLAMELASEAHRRDARVITGECVPVATAATRRGVPEALAHVDLSQPADAARVGSPAGKAGITGGPLHGLRSLLQAIADRCREGGPAISARILGGSAPVLARYESSLRGLLALDSQPDPEDLPAEAARVRLFRCLTEVIFAFASDCRTPLENGPTYGPLVLILDDLQWADELTLGFLDHLRQSASFGGLENRRDPHGQAGANPSTGTPFLIVGTYRAEEVAGEAHSGGGASILQRLIDAPEVTQIMLERLEESAIADLVGDMLAMAAPPEGFVQSLAAHADGNAFFIAEYLRAAVTEGLLFRDATGSWQTATTPASQASLPARRSTWFDSLPLPHSIHDLVSRRLQELPEPCAAVVAAAAVLGREGRMAILHAISGLDEAGFFDATGDLLRRQVLEATSVERLRFFHDQLREVALERIPQTRARLLHRAAAEAIEAVKASGGVRDEAEPESESVSALAHHWDEAGETIRGAHFWVEAGQNALGVYAMGEAEAALDRAIGALEVGKGEAATSDVLRALDARSRLRDHVGRFNDAAADAVRMAALSKATGDELRLGRAIRQEGVSLYNAGDYDSALDRYQKALAVLERVSEPEEICETRHLIGWIHQSRGDYQEAIRHLEAALETRGLAPDSLARWDSRMQLGLTMWALGEFVAAKVVFEELLHPGVRVIDRLRQARCQSALGLIQRECGDWEHASQLLELARETFRQSGAMQDFQVCSNNLGLIQIDRGLFVEAEHTFDAMRQGAETLGDALLEGIAELQLSYCRQCRDDAAAALSLAKSAVGRFQRLGNRPYVREGLLRLGMAYSEVGDSLNADEAFSGALSLARALNAPINLWKVAASWALQCLERNRDAALAGSTIDEATAVAAQLQQPEPNWIVQALANLAEILSAPEPSSSAWDRFEMELANLREQNRFLPLAQRMFLFGAECALERSARPMASQLLRRYRAIAHPEHLLNENRAAAIESKTGET